MVQNTRPKCEVLTDPPHASEATSPSGPPVNKFYPLPAGEAVICELQAKWAGPPFFARKWSPFLDAKKADPKLSKKKDLLKCQ